MFPANIFRPSKPIRVVVKDGRWDAYATQPISEEDHFSLKLIQGAGGINESVETGHYHFTWRYKLKGRRLVIVTDLIRVEEEEL